MLFVQYAAFLYLDDIVPIDIITLATVVKTNIVLSVHPCLHPQGMPVVAFDFILYILLSCPS